jgi:Zn-dependent protease
MSIFRPYAKWIMLFDLVAGPLVLHLLGFPVGREARIFLPILAFLAIGFVISVCLHELGHAFVGTYYGVKVIGFTLGPLLVDLNSGRIRKLQRLLGSKGHIAAVAFGPSTRSLHQAMREHRHILLAGPLTNLALAGVLIGYLVTFYDSQLGTQGRLITLAGMNIWIAIENFVFRRGKYSTTDGAKYARLRRGGLAAEVEFRAQQLVTSTMGPIRPSSWPSDFARTATELLQAPVEDVGPVTKPFVAMLLYDHLADLGHLATALSWIEWMEATLGQAKESSYIRFTDALIAIRARHYALWNNDPTRAGAVLCTLPPKSWIREYSEWLMPMALIQLSHDDYTNARKSVEKARKHLKPLVGLAGSAQMEMEWLDIIEQRINDASFPALAPMPMSAD